MTAVVTIAVPGYGPMNPVTRIRAFPSADFRSDAPERGVAADRLPARWNPPPLAVMDRATS